jgi:hypothetical protein
LKVEKDITQLKNTLKYLPSLVAPPHSTIIMTPSAFLIDEVCGLIVLWVKKSPVVCHFSFYLLFLGSLLNVARLMVGCTNMQSNHLITKESLFLANSGKTLSLFLPSSDFDLSVTDYQEHLLVQTTKDIMRFSH